MKLLLASIDTYPTQGGVARYSHELAEALGRAGADVHLLGPGVTYPGGVSAPAYQLIQDDAPLVPVLTGSGWRRTSWPRLKRRLSKLHADHKFDRMVALHPHYYGQAMARLSPELGIPFSVACHGLELQSELLNRVQHNPLRLRLVGHHPTMFDELQRIFAKADEVMANSHFTAGLVDAFNPKGTVRVTGCGVSSLPRLEASAENKSAIRAQLGIPENAPVAGYLGRLVESKGVETLIDAAAGLPDLWVLVCGDGPDRPRLEDLAHKLGVAARTVWTGLFEEARRASLLSAMDVFCLLSVPLADGAVEGFGQVLLEATDTGIPVVATATGGIVDFVTHGETGLLVPPRDVVQTRDAITAVLQDRQGAERRVTSAQAKIARDFNWPTIAAACLNVWRST